jgi:NADH-quinone oxidoreductase subunit M
MGIVGLGLATVTVDGLNGAVFQMFAHGAMTALFFSSVGYIYDRTHTKMIPELGGLSKIMPRASSYFIIAALAGIGVPCLASFWAELLVFIASFRVYPVRGTLAICALVVSALFMLRVVQRTFYGQKNERFAHLKDVSFGLGIPRMILVGVIVLFGLFPALMVDLVQTASIPLIQGLPR